MSDSIIDIIQENKLRSVKRSIQFSEQREKATNHHGEVAKSVLSGKPMHPALPMEAQTLRTTYYEMLKDYKGGSFYRVPGPINKKGVSLWKRVEKARQRAGVDPKTFLKAQFAWFHKNFGKAPTVEQLTTDAAVARVAEVGEVKQRRIVSNGNEAKIDLADVFRQSEKLLRDMMRAQGYSSREQFYRDFILTGVLTLPKEFLKADPAYRKVVND